MASKNFASLNLPKGKLYHKSTKLHPVHYPTRDLLRRLGLLKQGVTIFAIRQINDLNTEKNPSPAVT